VAAADALYQAAVCFIWVNSTIKATLQMLPAHCCSCCALLLLLLLLLRLLLIAAAVACYRRPTS
jgi:hypothetical protein